MSALPQTTLDSIVTGAENTAEAFIAPYVKKAADAAAKALGVTDPTVVALYEVGLSNLALGALATAALKLNALFAPKAK